MKKRIMLRALLFAFLAAIPAASVETWPVRVEWEAVKGARGYTVELRDLKGHALFKKNVAPSYAVIRLNPGVYRVRITALNAFMKPASSSGWSDLTVRVKEKPADESGGGTSAKIDKPEKIVPDGAENETRKKEEALKKDDELKREETLKREEAIRKDDALKREEELTKREEAAKREETLRKEELAGRRAGGYPKGLAGLGPLDIALGGSYHFPVTGWKRYLGYAPGGHITLSYRLSGINAVSNIPVLSNFGIALKFGVLPYSGRNRNRSAITMLSMSPGAGIFYDFKLGVINKWAFDLRLAMFMGPSFSLMKTRGLVTTNKRAVSFFYDPQLSFRFCYNGYFFIEVGSGYHSALLSGEPLSSVYPFVQVGIRL